MPDLSQLFVILGINQGPRAKHSWPVSNIPSFYFSSLHFNLFNYNRTIVMKCEISSKHKYETAIIKHSGLEAPSRGHKSHHDQECSHSCVPFYVYHHRQSVTSRSWAWCHTCNPSAMESRGKRITRLSLAQTIQQTLKIKRGWRCTSVSRPRFNLHHHQNQETKSFKSITNTIKYNKIIRM